MSRRRSRVSLFRDRADAARQLAEVLRGRELRQPLVLGIPRGGVVTGAVLARGLGADLDIVLARKLRVPGFPEVALGAVAETGEVYLNERFEPTVALQKYLAEERDYQMSEIARRGRLFRSVRPPASIAGRSVIVTDDGIATGSTALAALQAVRAQQPHELILAVPVAAPDSLARLSSYCDDVVCLLNPPEFQAVGQFYQDFATVEDAEVVELLGDFAPAEAARP
ncbi:MAG: phosphoribosyltransferase [Planctomycetia bacterium]|nr:phosphoribosyltransferase [Planctomycetia bacterium]